MSEGLKSPEERQKTKGRLGKAFDMALTLLVVLAAAVTAYVMIQNSRGRAVSFFGRSVLIVVTGSMEPSINEGDYILIKSAEQDALKAGDIITFVSHDEDIKGKLVTHRIIGVNGDGSFVTKGDANPVADDIPVKFEDIVGKYTGRARFFMLISSFASPKKILMLFGIVPLTLIALYEAKTLMKLLIESRVEEKMNTEEQRQRLMREEIEKEKQRLREEAENKENEEVKPDEPGSDNEAQNGNSDNS